MSARSARFSQHEQDREQREEMRPDNHNQSEPEVERLLSNARRVAASIHTSIVATDQRIAAGKVARRG